LLQLPDHAFKIGEPGAKAPGKPVSTALGHGLAIGEHGKLAGLARRNRGFNTQPLLDEGGETRRLGLIGSSSGAGTDFNVHAIPP
jgi:hypothetical protein